MGTLIIIIWGKAVMNYAYILLEFSAKYLVSKRREQKEEVEGWHFCFGICMNGQIAVFDQA